MLQIPSTIKLQEINTVIKEYVKLLEREIFKTFLWNLFVYSGAVKNSYFIS